MNRVVVNGVDCSPDVIRSREAALAAAEARVLNVEVLNGELAIRLGETEAQLAAAEAEGARLEDALREIAGMEPRPVEFVFRHPEDCEDCARYKDHPIQRGMCGRAWEEIYERDWLEKGERSSLPYRMKAIALRALAPKEART